MALSESDKKKLPLLLGLLLILTAYLCYAFIYKPMQVKATFTPPQAITHNSQPMASQVLDSPISLKANSNADLKSQEMPLDVYEYSDSQGNPVEAIYEPEPRHQSSKRDLILSAEDKQIVNYLRSNLLLELQTTNEELKSKRDSAKQGVSGSPSNPNGQPTKIVRSNNSDPLDLAGFSDMKTVQPTYLSGGLTTMQIDDIFEKVSVASIAVGGNGPESVSAYLRINGKLFQAFQGRRFGDYEVLKIDPNFLDIRYVPANVTRTIGHSGFGG